METYNKKVPTFECEWCGYRRYVFIPVPDWQKRFTKNWAPLPLKSKSGLISIAMKCPYCSHIAGGSFQGKVCEPTT